VKLATFVNPYTGEERMGILLADDDDPLMLDANAFFAKMLEEEGEEDPQVLADALLPPTVLGYLRRGRRAEESARMVLEEARRRLRNDEQITGISGARVTFRQSEVRLKAPIPRPPKIIHTAGNFREHAQEAEKAGRRRARRTRRSLQTRFYHLRSSVTSGGGGELRSRRGRCWMRLGGGSGTASRSQGYRVRG
jgi:2-keto-4-pentenoate hydratase/2-oxohepta-3-ene-1,7-dioic acid hydratase in catechol pathway